MRPIKVSTASGLHPRARRPASFADIVERVFAAVVSINVTSKVDVSAFRKDPRL